MAIGAAYAKGKWALGECARSGRKMLLRNMVADGYYPNLIVDPEWYEPKHPQESLPKVRDPTALYRPAPERDRIGNVLALGGVPGLDPVPGGGFGAPLDGTATGPGGVGSGAGGAQLVTGYTLSAPALNIAPGAVAVKASGFDLVTGSLTHTLDLSADLEVGCQAIVHLFSPTNSIELDSVADLRCIIPGHSGSSGFSSGVSSGALFWFPRQVTGDPTSFMLTASNAVDHWYAMWWVVRNLNLACPVQNVMWQDAATNVDVTGNPDFVAVNGAPQISGPNSSVLEIWMLHDPGSLATDPITTRKGVTPDDLMSFEVNQAAATRGGWIHAAFYNPGVVSLCENLLPETANQFMTGWDASGGSALTADADPHYSVDIDDGNTTGGPHGAFQTVTLSAGVTYCLAVHWKARDEQPWFIGWEEVAIGTINGQFFRMETSGSIPVVDQETDLNAGWDEQFHALAMRFSTLVTGQSFFFLTPANSGSYRIWHACPSDPDTSIAVLVYDSSASTRRLQVNSNTLSVGDFVPPFIPSLASAVPAPTVAPGWLPRTMMLLDNTAGRAWAGLPAKVLTMELCGNLINEPELIHIHDQEIISPIVDDDRLGVGNDYTRFPNNTHGNRSAGNMIGRLAFPAGEATGATGLYFCEMTVGASFGTPTDAVALGVYVGVFSAGLPGGASLSAADPGDQAAQRAWVASYMGITDGQTHHDGTTTNGLATYTTGDVIGIALDLVTGDVEWFKNGVSIRTETLSGEFMATPGGNAIAAYVGAVCGDNEGFALSWTMKAPFAFTKPSGFQDWDYLS